MSSNNPLQGYWAGSGISRGDTVLIHSSMKRTFLNISRKGYKPSSEIIIDSLLEEVGSKGTVLFPLFNFDFPDTKKFSLISTPSQMGKITEDARRNYLAARTGHPIYSFLAIGELASLFSSINNISGYGDDSPFAKLREIGGKIAVVDLDDQNSMTFYHHVEEVYGVDYRYHKEFYGEYEDLNGEITERKYSLFVRDLTRGVVTDVNRMGEILWEEGIYAGNRPGIKNGMRTVLAEELFQRTMKEIREGRAEETLFSISG